METATIYMYIVPYSFIYGSIATAVIVLGIIIFKLVRKRKHKQS